MHEAERAALADGLHDRQSHEMVAAGRERHDAGRMHLREERFDARERVHEIDRVHRRVAEVGAMGEAIGLQAADVVDVAHQGGLVAHLARPVARAGPVGRAAVPGHADDADLDAGRRRLIDADVRQPHEGGDARESRQHVAGDR